jgi:hypothetical protein
VIRLGSAGLALAQTVSRPHRVSELEAEVSRLGSSAGRALARTAARPAAAAARPPAGILPPLQPPAGILPPPPAMFLDQTYTGGDENDAVFMNGGCVMRMTSQSDV